MTVFVWLEQQVGDIKVFAATDAAEHWFEETNPEGVALSMSCRSEPHWSRAPRHVVVIKASQNSDRLGKPAYWEPAREMRPPPSEDIPLWPALWPPIR